MIFETSSSIFNTLIFYRNDYAFSKRLKTIDALIARFKKLMDQLSHHFHIHEFNSQPGTSPYGERPGGKATPFQKRPRLR